LSHYHVRMAGVVVLSESLLVERALVEVCVPVLCPAFVQTNLLDYFRGSSPEMTNQVGKLLESSPIGAVDIADYIPAEVAKG
ncbi:SDR family oxidoreductase, partial [Pseudomonas aeruginosa]